MEFSSVLFFFLDRSQQRIKWWKQEDVNDDINFCNLFIEINEVFLLFLKIPSIIIVIQTICDHISKTKRISLRTNEVEREAKDK